MAPRVNQVILIIIDDIRSSHFFKWVDEGKLPNIASLCNGIVSRNCLTTFPSITLPTQPNIMTGSYSGYYPKEGSGIPTYHWVAREDPPAGDGAPPPFIRNYGGGTQAFKMNDDLGPNAKTLFEQAGDGNKLSVMQFVHRGARVFPNSMATVVLGYIWYMFVRRDPSKIDHRLVPVVEKAFRKPTKFFETNEVPRATVCYIPGTDYLMHEYGFDHARYVKECLRCDEYVGGLLKTLKDTGHYDDTAIAIVTDHGNYKARRAVDLEPFFERRGLVPYTPKDGRGDFDATFGSIGFFNFRGDTWHHHPTSEQLRHFKPSGLGASEIDAYETLWEVPGVQLMYYPDDSNTPDRGVIHLEKRVEVDGSVKVLKGTVEFEGHGREQRTAYKFESDDLFGYSASEDARAVLDGRGHTVGDWLAATAGLDFPLVVDQLPRYFKNPRACDVMVSTRADVCFNYEHGKTTNEHVYSHDVGLPVSMSVPLIIGGSPEVPRVDLPFCKTTDIVPTLLALLGETPHPSVVGRSLVD
ncbi:MAG: alkaline phosphatase family protein [Promethearchaeota archaeon]